ncbi:MAG: 16S rRNA (uracil(1498)-N(3))-methyltransferase, partial [Microcoleaceae cyanobacterium]
EYGNLPKLAIAPNNIVFNEKEYATVHLNSEQEHYLRRVLRLNAGDRLVVMDGCGHWWLAVLVIEDICHIELLSEININHELPVQVNLIVGLPKNGFEDIIRSATELGVYRLIPVISSRTVLKPSEQKWQRWQKIAQEASEQSERQVIPEVLPTQSYSNFFDSCSSIVDFANSQKFIAVTRMDAQPLKNLLVNASHHQSIYLATGPEGGWTTEEINRAIALNFQPISLGKRILRAVTAPLTALSIIASQLEGGEDC